MLKRKKYLMNIKLTIMKYALLIVLAITLIGCKSTYVKVYETKSKKNIGVEDNKYVYENDTLKVIYNFWYNKGLVDFTIYNKLDIPIYIDWKKSSYIDNSVKLNYWEDEENTLSAGIQSFYYYNGYYNEFSDYQHSGRSKTISKSSKTKEERITFIPPKSIYKRAQYHILPNDINTFGNNAPYKEVPLNGNSKSITKFYEKKFTKENTPLIYRNFLTSSLTEDFESEFYIDNEFYISKVLKMDKRHFYGKYYNSTRRTDYLFRDFRNFYIDTGIISTPKKKIKVEINKNKG